MNPRLGWVFVVSALVAAACGTSPAGGASGVAGTSGGASDAGVTGGSSGNGGIAGTSAAPGAPVVTSFTGTPATLPAGGGAVTLSWLVTGATSITIDNGVGVATGSSTMVNVTATTIYTLTAKNAAGTTTDATAVVIGTNPSAMGNRYVAMVSPTNGESFLAPATLRLIAAAHDPNVDTNSPADGLGGNAQKVQFFVDDALALEVDGAHAEFWMFKGFTADVAAGTHRVWARATYTNPDAVLDSPPALVTVAAPPTYDMTVDLAADVLMTGATGYELVGAAGKRIRLNGHGHRILSDASASGPLTLKFVDAFDLGGPNTGNVTSFDVTTTGTITVEDSTFDTSNTIALDSEGAGTVSIRRDLFRSNMRMPIGQNPRSGPAPSYPSIDLSGKSTGAKVFAGNNTAAGWVEIESSTNWLVGGDTDADSNVLIGPRVGIYMETTTNSNIRRNFSHHNYFGGWSQGSNFELGGTTATVVEHNVIYDSSWPVRFVSCEFRYNLVAEAGHEFLWPTTGGNIHHNVFEGGSSDIASIYTIDKSTGVTFANNTVDGQLDRDMVSAVTLTADSAMTLSSNAFLNVPTPLGAAPGATIVSSGGTLTSDYNAFGNMQKIDYAPVLHPAHDVDLADGAAALLTTPQTTSFDIDETTIWNRTTTVPDILAMYRARYAPQDGSPLIDKGDPAGGVGNDIGAVGAGTPNAADKFGVF